MFSFNRYSSRPLSQLCLNNIGEARATFFRAEFFFLLITVVEELLAASRLVLFRPKTNELDHGVWARPELTRKETGGKEGGEGRGGGEGACFILRTEKMHYTRRIVCVSWEIERERHTQRDRESISATDRQPERERECVCMCACVCVWGERERERKREIDR